MTERKPEAERFSQATSTVAAARKVHATEQRSCCRQMLAGEAEAITQKAIAMAKNGDGLALKLFLERLIPPAKDRHIQLTFPPVHTAQDVIEASSRLVQAVAEREHHAWGSACCVGSA